MHFKNFRFLIALLMLCGMMNAAFAQASGFDPSRMDRTVDACDDFFSYVNGNWLRSTSIPASEARWGTFNILADSNNTLLKKILEGAVKAPGKKGSDSQLTGDFYESCINEAAIEKAGKKPIEKILKKIAAIKNVNDLEIEIAQLHKEGYPALFMFGIGPDAKDSNTMLASAGQGGISMPNRDYYTLDDENSKATREKFVEYMKQIFTALGQSPETSAANAATVLKMQTRLAIASLTPVERRNPDNTYNKISVGEANKLTPNFDWTQYINERGASAATQLNFAPTKFFNEMNTMLKDTPLDDWKIYLTWMVTNSSASSLSKAFADPQFDFFGKHLSGQKERQPRWKTCVQATDGALGEALGMEYAKIAFKPEAKARMNELIDNLMAALKSRIDNLEWMSPETKKQAQGKLSSFTRKIGYPDKLRGYKGLDVKRDSYASNIRRVSAFQVQRNIDDLGKPRDRSRMGMTPPTVNASYNPTNNDITFPAGILQPPFFNFAADDALNYGGIGGVIGHEISHGFDDQGSRYDADGNLKMWWTPDDRKKFEDRAACVVNQFDGFEVQPGLFMNGKLTLGENIGDLAGLTISYDAFMRSMEGKPRPANIDGFTPEQRFFLSWAQVWAGKYTPQAEIQQVRGNPHALPRWRVNGPLSNMPQFAKAFGCKDGQAMVKKDACSIW